MTLQAVVIAFDFLHHTHMCDCIHICSQYCTLPFPGGYKMQIKFTVGEISQTCII